MHCKSSSLQLVVFLPLKHITPSMIYSLQDQDTCHVLVHSPVTVLKWMINFGTKSLRAIWQIWIRSECNIKGPIQPENTHLPSGPGCSFLPSPGVDNQWVFVTLQDTVIYDRLADSSRYKEITLKHLEQFATEGEWTDIAPCLPHGKHLLGMLLMYVSLWSSTSPGHQLQYEKQLSYLF